DPPVSDFPRARKAPQGWFVSHEPDVNVGSTWIPRMHPSLTRTRARTVHSGRIIRQRSKIENDVLLPRGRASMALSTSPHGTCSPHLRSPSYRLARLPHANSWGGENNIH